MLERGYVVMVKMAEFDFGLAASRRRRLTGVVVLERSTLAVACGERVVGALPAGCVKRREWTDGRRLTVNVTHRGA